MSDCGEECMIHYDDNEWVNATNPDYYKRGQIEIIDVIESVTAGLTGVDAFCVGNAVKYLARYKDKGGVEDLRKAQWYINRLIEKGEKNHG